MSVLLHMKTGEVIDNAVKSPHYYPEAEWPLIILTISMQSAVGTLVWGLLWSGLGQVLSEVLLATLVLGAIGMLGAVGHLASPLRAPRAILNWRSSWLSREIILSAAFMGLVMLAAGISLQPFLMGGKMIIPPLVSGVISILAWFIGIALLGAMSMIYLVPTRPVWNHKDTLTSFYTGAFQIGWGISAAMMVVRGTALTMGTVTLITAGIILLTLLRLKVFFSVVDRLNGLNLFHDQPYGWQTNRIRQTRIVLAVSGGIAAPLVGFAVMLLPWIIRGTNTQWILILAALLLIIGEGMERWVFFQTSPAVIFPPRF